MTGNLNDLIRRLAADLSSTGLHLEAGVYDLEHRCWLTREAASAPIGFGSDGWVLILPGRQQLIPPAESDEVDVVAMMEAVQEWAMDELGYGWPELVNSAGDFVALLAPDLDGEEYVWSERGIPRVVVGGLRALRVRSRPST